MDEFDNVIDDHYKNNLAEAGAEDLFADEPAEPVKQDSTEQPSLFRRVTLDIGGGMAQAPRSAVRGAVKGVNEMADFISGVADLAPTISFLNEQGNMSYPRISTGGAKKERLKKKAEAMGMPEPDFTPPRLPVPNKPLADTVTGDLIEGVSQFLAGFGAAGKMAKAAGVAAKGAAGAIGKGAIGDVISFDEQDQRLSNVIQSVPELQNPVTEYLQASPDDSFAEGKFKQAVEGLGLGAVGEAIGKGVSLLKRGKQIDMNLQNTDLTPEQTLTSKDFSSIGDIDDPALVIKKYHKEADVVEAGAKQVDTVAGKLGKAADESATAMTKPQGKPEIRINFARIQGEDDVKNLMQQMANDPDLIASVQGARRGKQTVEMTLKGADDIDGFDELLTRRTGEAFNDQQIVAARKVYYDTTEKLLEVAQKAASPQATELDQYTFRQMVAVHHAVQKEMLGARAEAGRALRAWAIPLEGSDGEKIKAIQSMLNSYGGAEASKDMAAKIALMAGDGGLNTAQLNAITSGGALARTGAAMQEVWKMGLLTSPRTHIVNIGSNLLTGFTLAAERGMVGKLSADDKLKFEATQFFVGYIGSLKEALMNASTAWKTGETGRAFGKIELPPIRATSREVLDPDGKMGIFSKAIDAYGALLNKVVGGGLAAGDEFGKTMLYRAQLRALAARDAAAKGLSGDAAKKHMADILTDPNTSMRMDAEEFAKMGTYNNALKGSAQNFSNLINKVPAARFVVPFVRTPINIFKFTFERTPLGLVSKNMRDNLAAGGARRTTALAKLGMGSSFMMLGTDMALNGDMTGAGPADPKMRAKLMNTGWKPYSLKIGDNYYSYARWEPFATWLGMSADLSEILSNYEAYDMDAQEEVDGLATAAVAAMANQLVGKTFMSGFADITSALADPKRYGDSMIQSYGRSIVPNAIADIERAVSPEVEQVFNMMDAIKSRIPGLSDSVGKRYNVYGEPIKAYYPSPDNKVKAFGESVAQIVNPIIMSDVDAPEQPLDKFFLENGLDGISMPPKTQRFEVRGRMGTIERVPVNLSEYPQVYNRFMQLRGEVKLPQYYGKTMKGYLTALVERKVPGSAAFYSPFIKGTDAQQNIIRKVQQDYDTEIRKRLMDEFSVLKQAAADEQRNAEQIEINRSKRQ